MGPQRVEDETRALAATLREQRPNEVREGEWLGATPLDRLEFKDSAKVLMAVALVVLLLVAACTNLGTLLLARGLAREREIRQERSICERKTRWEFTSH